MPIEDSNPERRNLVVTSIGFIAYYYGSGSFGESEISIQAISLHFKNSYVLGVMAWSTFLWFLLRYWQVQRGSFLAEFHQEMREFRWNKFLIDYVENRTGLRSNVDGGFRVGAPYFEGLKFKVSYDLIAFPEYGPEDEIVDFRNGGEGAVALSGPRGFLVAARILFTYALRDRSFSEYLVPYILALVALVGAIRAIAL